MAGTSIDADRDEASLRRGMSTAAGAAVPLRHLAEAALAVLANTAEQDGGVWQARVESPDGSPLDIECRGPSLPATVPDRIVSPDLVLAQRPWVGSHRLVVTAPLIVLDLFWSPDEPLRIMTFSRGDWEAVLAAAA